MADVWFKIFRDLLLQFDQWLRVPLGWQFPGVHELRTRPLDYFDRHGEVRVGPNHRLAVTVFLSFFVGFGLLICGSVVLGGGRIPPPRVGPKPPLATRLATLAGTITAIILPVFLTVRYVLRGGELWLGPDGVRFRHRGTEIVCPWAVFAASGETQRPDQEELYAPARSDAVVDVVATTRDGTVTRGRDVDTKPIRFPDQDVVEIADLYRCWLPGLVELIRDVAGNVESAAVFAAAARRPTVY